MASNYIDFDFKMSLISTEEYNKLMALKDAQAAKDVSVYFWQEVAKSAGGETNRLKATLGVANAELAASRDSVERLSRLLKQAHETNEIHEDAIFKLVEKNNGLQEQVGRYAAECSRLNLELTNAKNKIQFLESQRWQSPYVITCSSGNVGIGSTK